MFFFRFTAGWSDQPVRAALLFCVPEIVRDRMRLLWEQDGIIEGAVHSPAPAYCLLGQYYLTDRVLCPRLCHHQFTINPSDLLAHRVVDVYHGVFALS